MAEVIHTITVNMTEKEAKLVASLLRHVRLGNSGWNNVAAELAISMEPYFDESELPQVDFTFEDSSGGEIVMSGIYVTVEVNPAEEEV